MIRSAVLACVLALAPGANAAAGGGWPALASDRSASRVGDSLTVLVFESATASNASQRDLRKETRLAAEASTSPSNTHRAQGSLAGDFAGGGRTTRSDRMVASISVVVVDVLPNGDLRVAGEQSLLVNGERTQIRVAGRVRPADISGDNTVLSTRMAESDITYRGGGFDARASKPGIVYRILDRLGAF